MAARILMASVVLTLVGSSCGDGVPQDLSFIRAMVEPYASCTPGKLSCSVDCKSIVYCLEGQVETVETCVSPDTMCDAATVTCKAVDDVTCGATDPDKLTCRGPVGGRFPNPSDCHSYFECPDPPAATPASVSKVDCQPNTTAYDPLSTTCRFKDTARVCKDGPVPECKTALQAGALVENPNIYYVCVPVNGFLQTWLVKCKDPTTIFQDGKCVSADATSTGAVTTTSTGTITTTSTGVITTTTTGAITTTSTAAVPTTSTAAVPTTSTAAVTTTTTAAVPTTTAYYCLQPGTTVPDPLDCHSYYYCTSDMVQIHYTCRPGYHYDRPTGYCLKGTTCES